jgi:hypothetical protein
VWVHWVHSASAAALVSFITHSKGYSHCNSLLSKFTLPKATATDCYSCIVAAGSAALVHAQPLFIGQIANGPPCIIMCVHILISFCIIHNGERLVWNLVQTSWIHLTFLFTTCGCWLCRVLRWEHSSTTLCRVLKFGEVIDFSIYIYIHTYMSFVKCITLCYCNEPCNLACKNFEMTHKVCWALRPMYDRFNMVGSYAQKWNNKYLFKVIGNLATQTGAPKGE